MKHLPTILFATLVFASSTGANSSRWSGRLYGADLSRGPLNVFRSDSLFCGGGWIFPGLIWGDRTVSACIYKPTQRKNVFGGEFGF